MVFDGVGDGFVNTSKLELKGNIAITSSEPNTQTFKFGLKTALSSPHTDLLPQQHFWYNSFRTSKTKAIKTFNIPS